MRADEVVWFGHPPSRVDLLRTIDGVTTEAVFANAQRTVVDDVPIAFIALDDLIANKRASGRDVDLLDVSQLERIRAATKPEVE